MQYPGKGNTMCRVEAQADNLSLTHLDRPGNGPTPTLADAVALEGVDPLPARGSWVNPKPAVQ
jgi:hypothetical protein